MHLLTAYQTILAEIEQHYPEGSREAALLKERYRFQPDPTRAMEDEVEFLWTACSRAAELNPSLSVLEAEEMAQKQFAQEFHQRLLAVVAAEMVPAA